MSPAAEVLALMDKHMPTSALSRIGLAADEVRRLALKAKPLTPEETRRALAKHTRLSRRGTWGRRGLPEHVVRAMYAEYQAGKSCTEVAQIFGGTRQSVHEIFASHGLQLRPRHPHLFFQVVYRGEAFTPGKHGYYRATKGDRAPLHHRIWIDANGPIPDGWQVMFEDGNRTNCALENLRCKPASEVMAEQRRRQALKKHEQRPTR